MTQDLGARLAELVGATHVSADPGVGERAAAAAGLLFGVDLAARDTATIRGMASTNAGGLRTVRYGNMGEQVLGLEVVLPSPCCSATSGRGTCT